MFLLQCRNNPEEGHASLHLLSLRKKPATEAPPHQCLPQLVLRSSKQNKPAAKASDIADITLGKDVEFKEYDESAAADVVVGQNISTLYLSERLL